MRARARFAVLAVAPAVALTVVAAAQTPAPSPLTAPTAVAGATPLRPGAAPRPVRPGVASLPPTPLSLAGLPAGGGAAPLCRADCATALYACLDGAGTGESACFATQATCRRTCDAASAPAGRLQSPLPAAGLAPVGPLRPLPGAPPPSP